MLTNSELAELLARAIRVARYQCPPMPDSHGRSRTQIARSERYRRGWNEGYAAALANIVRALEPGTDLSFEALADLTD